MIVLHLPARRPGAKRRRFDRVAVLVVSRHRLAVFRVDLVVGVAKEGHELTERHLVLPHVERLRDAHLVTRPFARQQAGST